MPVEDLRMNLNRLRVEGALHLHTKPTGFSLWWLTVGAPNDVAWWHFPDNDALEALFKEAGGGELIVSSYLCHGREVSIPIGTKRRVREAFLAKLEDHPDLRPVPDPGLKYCRSFSRPLV